MAVDIVVFGGTGFTGRLVVEYLLRDNETKPGRSGALTWAIAARDADKIDTLKRELKQKLEKQGDDASIVDAVPVIIADGKDRDAVLAMVRAARVVVSLAGPYAVYSALVVELCAQHGVHYCDIAAEVSWAARNAEAWDETARASGARLIHCCGFESVPSDLLTFLLADQVARDTVGTPGGLLSRVNFFWKASLGGASGGTVISLLSMLDAMSPEQKGTLMAPFLFTPRAYAEQKQHLVEANTSTKKIPFDRELRARSAFFVTGMIDQQVVLRSNYLFQDQYGAAFTYIERMSLASVLNWFITAAMATFAGLASWKWTRKLLWKLAPKSGTGPSPAAMQRGYFSAEAHAYNAAGELAAKGAVSGVGDPGYLITSRLISQVALCLARDEHDGALDGGGFLTPATACGHSLVRRLNEKKVIDMSVESVARKTSRDVPPASSA